MEYYLMLGEGDIMMEGDEMYTRLPHPDPLSKNGKGWHPIDMDTVGEIYHAEKSAPVRRRSYAVDSLISRAKKLVEWADHTRDGVNVKLTLRRLKETFEGIDYEAGKMGDS